MQELESLKSMWAKKTKRKTDLIIPKVSYDNEHSTGSLNNENWFFKVPYAFREALDIKYEERKKDKKGYMVWTQGPILSFKDGDNFTAKDNKTSLQVQFSNPMGWDSAKDEMYQGSVVFDEFIVNDQKHIKINQHSCNQMQFLKVLIGGVINC